MRPRPADRGPVASGAAVSAMAMPIAPLTRIDSEATVGAMSSGSRRRTG